jgi:hypothetical protein
MLSAQRIAAVGIIGLAVGLFNATAIAAEPSQSSPPATMPAAPPAERPSEATEEAVPVPLRDSAEPFTCPPGQFPSAFADVYPFHWAYAAVTNLTSEAVQCFDWPDEY